MAEFGKNDRVVILEGPHKGEHGKVIRKFSRSEWMVKRDSRMSPDFYTTEQLAKENQVL